MAGFAEACMANFERHYAIRLVEHSQPYPGIVELLGELVSRGILIGVLSNKPHHFTLRCVAALLDGFSFASVVGQHPEYCKETRSDFLVGNASRHAGFAQGGSLRRRYGYRHENGVG